MGSPRWRIELCGLALSKVIILDKPTVTSGRYRMYAPVASRLHRKERGHATVRAHHSRPAARLHRSPLRASPPRPRTFNCGIRIPAPHPRPSEFDTKTGERTQPPRSGYSAGIANRPAGEKCREFE